MSPFHDASRIESKSLDTLLPWLKEMSSDGQVVLVPRGPRAATLQQVFGDVLVQTANRLLCIEVKAEEEKKYGNFFLETWSNLPSSPDDWTHIEGKQGWLYTTRADLIIYHFVNDGCAYLIPVSRLKHWAFTLGNIYRYNERKQTKREQRNITAGRPVPIKELLLAIPEITRRDFPVAPIAAVA